MVQGGLGVCSSACLGDEGIKDVPGFLWRPNVAVHYLKFVFINRDKRSQKNPRKMDQSLILAAERANLLKVFEKNLEIPQDCTYADQKAIDAEVSP